MTSAPAYTPDRGDIIWIDFDPHAGHEQAGRRPGLVLTPRSYNGRVGLAIICPITGQAKGYTWEVPLPAGLPVYGVVLADQARSLDWQARRATFACQLDPAIVADVLLRLNTLLK